MALIKCPECGREISEFAPHCIGCGCPMTRIKQILSTQQSKTQANNSNSDSTRFNTKSDGFLTRLSSDAKKCVSDYIEAIHLKYGDTFRIAEYKARLRITFNTVPQFITWFAFTTHSGELKLCYKIENDLSAKYMLAKCKGEYSVKKLLAKISPIVEDLGAVNVMKKAETDAPIYRLFGDDDCDIFCYFFYKELKREFGNRFKAKVRGHYLLFKEKEDEPAVFWLQFKDKLLSLFVRQKSGSKKNMLVVYSNMNEIQLCMDFVRKHLILGSSKKELEKPKTEKQPKSKREEGLALYSDLTTKEQSYIDEFEHILMSNYEGLSSRETKYTYRYRHKGFDRNVFWFTKPGNDLMFKYWENVNSDNETTISIKVSDHSPESLAMIARNVLKKININPIKRRQLLPINDLIVKALKGNKISGPSKYVEVAKDVAAYTLNYLYNKYKDLKAFKTREEFDRYKNSHNDYVYHGRGMSLKYPTLDDAEFCFKYYISSKLLEVIQRYERLLNEQIITDYKQLLDSYYELINKNDDAFTSVNGINSNINSVPFTILEEEFNKYLI